jgi:hypothetical protein
MPLLDLPIYLDRIATALEQLVALKQPKPRVKAPVKGYSKEFENFWSVYPRKTGKTSAWTVWKKIKPSAGTRVAMKLTIEAFKKSEDWTKDNGQYIPHPATWLRQGRWEDEIAKKEVSEWD